MLHVILHDKIYWKFSPFDITCWINMQAKNQYIFFLLYASNPQFTKVVSFCAVNSKVKRKKNNFPLFYATKYLGFLWWNLPELNLFLRSVGCPNLGQSKYTKNSDFNFNDRYQATKLQRLLWVIYGFFPRKWCQRDITFVKWELVYLKCWKWYHISVLMLIVTILLYHACYLQ